MGPFLFIGFNNDLPSAYVHSSINMLTDDTPFLTITDALEDDQKYIQKYLDKLIRMDNEQQIIAKPF